MLKKVQQRIIRGAELAKADRKVFIPAGPEPSSGEPTEEECKEKDMKIEPVKGDDGFIEAIQITCPCGREVLIQCVLEGEDSHEFEDM